MSLTVIVIATAFHLAEPEPGMRMLRQMVGSVNEVASRREMNFWSDNCVYFFPESTSVKFKLLLVITGP